MSEPVPSGYIAIPIYLPELTKIMSNVNEVKDKVEALAASFTEMQQRVEEDVQALKDKLDQAGLDETVLNEVNEGLDRITTRVKALDPDPANPPQPTQTQE